MASRLDLLSQRLGRRIVQLRTELGMTQEGLAWACEKSKGYLSRIEAGERLPSIEILDRIAKELGVEPRDLLVFPSVSPVHAAMESARLGRRVTSGEGVSRAAESRQRASKR